MTFALAFVRNVPLRAWLLALGAFILFGSVVACNFAWPFLLARSLALLHTDPSAAGTWLALALACFAWAQGAASLQFLAYVHFEQHLQNGVQALFFESIQKVGYGRYAERAPDDYSITLDRGTTGLRNMMFSGFFWLLPLLVETSVFVIVAMTYLDAPSAGAIMALVAAHIGLTVLGAKRVMPLQARWIEIAVHNYTRLAEAFRNAISIRVFGKRDVFSGLLRERQIRFNRGVIAAETLNARVKFGQGLIVAVLFAVVITMAWRRTATGALPITDFYALSALALQLVRPLQNFAFGFGQFLGGWGHVKKMLDILRPASDSHRAGLVPDPRCNGHVELRNVAVRVRDRVLVSVGHLAIPAGSLVVLTGRSGSGKSTFARMLAGLLGHSGHAAIRAGREKVAYLGQDPEIFDADIFFNVGLDAAPDRDRVADCLARAGFSAEEHASLMSRDLGESGRNISGGQKLRIGIARMLYHGADLMIFDEPTAALDAESAARVLEAIRHLPADRTRLVITHDPTLAAEADFHLTCEAGVIAVRE